MVRRLSALGALALLLIVSCASPQPARAASPSVAARYTGSGSGDCTTNCTLSVNVTPTPGDLVVFFVFVYDGSGCPTSVTTPSGFTAAGTPVCGNARNETYVFWKVAQSGDTAYSTVITTASGSVDYTGAVFDVSGANTTTPFDVLPTYAAPTGATTQAAPAITTSQANDLLLSAWANAYQRATANSITAGWTQYDDNNKDYTTEGAIAQTAPGTNGPPSVGYGTAPTYIQTTSLAIAPAGTTLPSGLPLTGAGGPHLSTTEPFPTPPPTASPSPTPTPATGAPALTDTINWFAVAGVPGGTNVSSGAVAQFYDWCVGGSPANSAGVLITACAHALAYASLTLGEPNTSGTDGDWPFDETVADTDRSAGPNTSNCPTASTQSAFWAAQTPFNGTTIPDYTSSGSGDWMSFVGTGSIGNAANLGLGYAGSIYRLYLNMASPSLSAWLQATIQNCALRANTAVPNNALYGAFEDNAFYGLQSKDGSIWDDYPQGKNFGTGSASPYADATFGKNGSAFSPSAFFNGAIHTRTSLITSSDTPTLTYTTDTAWGDAQAAFWQCCTHRDGSPFYFLTNGGTNDYTNFWTQSHHLGTTQEEYDTGCFGTCPANSATVGWTSAQTKAALGVPYSARQIINNLAKQYNDILEPGVNANEHIVTLADQAPLEGNQYNPEGASWQQDLRWHFMVPWVAMSNDHPDQWVSWVNYCNETSCTNTFGGNFVMPSGRYQAMPADPTPYPCGAYGTSAYNYTGSNCSGGGALDAAIGCGGATSGLWCVEFAHLWVEQVTGSAPCTAFSRANWTASSGACVHDIGPALLIVNDSTASATISATNLAAWAPHIYSSISSGHLVSLCNDAVSGSPMYNWSSGGKTYVYRYDYVSSGTGYTTVCSGTSGMDFNAGGAPASGDAVFHDYALANVLGDLLAPGEAMMVVP